MSWIASKTRRMNGTWGRWPDMNKKNVERMRVSERNGRLDFVLYGDSIVSFHFGYTISKNNPATPSLWKKHFGSLNAVPMGIPGDQIGQVVWRLQRGGEKPAVDPKVIGLLIGVNDVIRFGEDKTKPRTPSTEARMETLLNYIRTSMPGTAVLLCGLTPMTNQTLLKDRHALNESYKSLAARFASQGMRIRFLDCSSSFTSADGTPISAGYLSDTLHLTAKAHDIVLTAMRAAVDEFAVSSGGIQQPSTAPTISNSIVIGCVSLFVIACFCSLLSMILVA